MALGTFTRHLRLLCPSPQNRGLVPESRPRPPSPAPWTRRLWAFSRKGITTWDLGFRGFLSAEGFQVHAPRKRSVFAAGSPGEGEAAGSTPAGCPRRGATGHAAPASSRPLTGQPFGPVTPRPLHVWVRTALGAGTDASPQSGRHGPSSRPCPPAPPAACLDSGLQNWYRMGTSCGCRDTATTRGTSE